MHIPEKLAALAVILALGACGTITAEKHGRTTRLIYDAGAPDSITGDSSLTAFYRNEMQKRAAQACPNGFKKTGEGHVVRPKNRSATYWDIACL